MIARLAQDRNGAVVAELAAILPVLLLLGGIEVSRYALLNQKLDRVATTMGDLVSQAPSLTVAEIDSLFAASRHVVTPFDLEEHGIVIVTSVGAMGGTPRVNWQRSGAGDLSAVSAVGAPGSNAELPEGMLVRDGETLIVAEVFYDFEPFLFGAVAPASEIYHRAFFRPRIGALNVLHP